MAEAAANRQIPPSGHGAADSAHGADHSQPGPGSPASQGSWWPWISRFLWSPAVDLHPSRRESLLPGWPTETWSDPAVLAHVSRHLLVTHELLDVATRWDYASDCPVALLPQAPLARLARGVGLVLHGGSLLDAGTTLNDEERSFIRHRAPLYWSLPSLKGDDPDATGWEALRVLVGRRSLAIERRFDWKNPRSCGKPASLPDADQLRMLVGKVLKEFEEPWCFLFGTLRAPRRRMRLRG